MAVHRPVAVAVAVAAVVVGAGGGTTLPSRRLTAHRSSAVSLVAVRTAARWRFAHFQNTRIGS